MKKLDNLVGEKFPETPEECTYYFKDVETFKTSINQICIDNQNDLSNITIGFADTITELSGDFFNSLFPVELKATPKMILANNLERFTYVFSGNSGGNNPNLIQISKNFFRGCPNITYMEKIFSNCTKLVAIPDGLLDFCTKIIEIHNLFSNCISILFIPNKLFKKCNKLKILRSGFNACTSLLDIPDDLFEFNIELEDVQKTFMGANIRQLNDNLFRNCQKLQNVSHCFNGCKNLQEIPALLFDKNNALTHINACFSNCFNIKQLTATMFDTCTQLINVTGCFGECKNIVSAIPKLWDSIKFKNITDHSKFAFNCVNASNYNEIPVGWK